MIDIVTRYIFPDLQNRMERSAILTAGCPVTFYKKPGNMEESTPKDINALALSGKNPFIVFTHDDVEFISSNWGNKLIETFGNNDWDIIGVVGCKKYSGGLTFAAGYPHCAGKYVSDIDGKNTLRVKIFGPEPETAVECVDGMFMAVRREYFEKEQFDPTLEFYVENDYCVRSGKVGIADILIAHYKTPKYYGAKVWPVGHDCEKDSAKSFHAKHGLTPQVEKDRRCACVDAKFYLDNPNQSEIFSQFENKYMEGAKC
jgi:hypothetical protein